MNTADKHTVDIAIVGGGMVGASMACLLGNLPLRVGLIDRAAPNFDEIPFNAKQPKFDARVSAITPASKQLFSDIGIWEEIAEKRCCSYGQMQVWDADGTGSVHFSAADIEQDELGNIVENSIILAALHKKMSSVSNLQVFTLFAIENLNLIRVDGERLAQLQATDGRQVNAKLIIAADGANSKIRQLANFSTREWDYNHQALATTIRTELPHGNTALQRFMDTGPLAFLPLGRGPNQALGAAPDQATGSSNGHALNSDDQHYCSIVWSMLPEKAEQIMSLEDDEFRLQLAASMEHKLGKVEWSDQRFTFPLHQKHAVDYVSDNVALVGDAAHSIHPLAGQGVNLGLQDVRVLAEELQRAIAAGREPSDATVLRRFQRRRIGHNLGMMWLMEGFKHLFAEQALPTRWLRNFGMSSVDSIPFIKNQLARRAMGLDW